MMSSLSSLESDRSRILALADTIPVARLEESPRRDEWSISGLLEHIVIVEERLLMALIEGSTAAIKTVPFSSARLLRKMIVGFVLNNGIKVPTIKSRNVEPTGSRSYEHLLLDWQKVRDGLNEFLQSQVGSSKQFLEQFIFTHPRIGDCNGADTIWFMAKHLRYHRVRAERVFRVVE